MTIADTTETWHWKYSFQITFITMHNWFYIPTKTPFDKINLHCWIVITVTVQLELLLSSNCAWSFLVQENNFNDNMTSIQQIISKLLYQLTTYQIPQTTQIRTVSMSLILESCKKMHWSIKFLNFIISVKLLLKFVTQNKSFP